MAKALQYLEEPFNDSNIFNLGNGNGFSVKEVVDTCKKVTGIDFDVKIEGRRPGDPDILIADSYWDGNLKLQNWKTLWNLLGIGIRRFMFKNCDLENNS